MTLTEKECRELLPWYVNGTLSADETQAVEALLQDSETLRAEVEKLKCLKENLPEPQRFPGSELGWRILQKQIRADRINAKSPQWKSYIAIAAMLVITLQIGLFALMQKEPSTNVQLLGGQSVLVQSEQLLLQVQIAPDASWQEVTEIFSALNASIVQGPSAMGVIYVQVGLQDLILNGELVTQTQQVLDWLSAQNVIQHVAVEHLSTEQTSTESGE